MAEPRVEIAWTYEEDADGRIELGETLRGVVSVYSEEEVGCRGILLWVGCKVHGRGTDEQIDALPETHIHMGPLPAGEWVKAGFEVRVPHRAPVSYQGRYIKCDWQAIVRLDIPLWFDRRFPFNFVVLPRDAGSRDAGNPPTDQSPPAPTPP
jgi:hypothetical protein